MKNANSPYVNKDCKLHDKKKKGKKKKGGKK